MASPLKSIRLYVRAGAHQVALWLDTASKGRLTPDAVTITGFLMHVPIALLIGSDHRYWAAGLLVVFGLFDTLDGELSRLQKRSSPRGMLLDASTDRMKEVLIYAGAAYFFLHHGNPDGAVWAAAAVGASVCVSYVKAKGEAAVASLASDGKGIPHATLNRMFSDGLLTFEIRMAVLVVGLLAGQLFWAVALIAVLASYTALQRLVKISKHLK